jgi:hypothetical protein
VNTIEETQMFHFRTLAAAPALVFLMGGTAHAALTVDQVWQSWKDSGAAIGLTISAATESNADGVLTLNGVSILPAGDQTPFTISDMTLTEQDDGTVTIEPGATIGIDLDENGTAAKVNVVHDGLVITASEDAGAVVYDFEAASLTMDMEMTKTSFGADGTAKSTQIGKFGFEELVGAYSDTPGANRAFGLDLAATTMILNTSTDDPGMSMKTTSTSQTEEFAIALDVTLPSTTPLASIQGPADFRKVLEEGLSVAMAFSQGNSSGTSKDENEFFPMDMTVSSLPGEGTLTFDKDAFSVDSKGGGVTVQMTSAAFPAPVDISVGEVTMNMLIPVIAPTAADLVVKMKLNQLVLGDGVWGMFDPGAALKRDPLDLNIDVAAKTTMDLVALAESEETGAPPPIPAPESLDITDITLKVAGAALGATGAFTFDNSMGMPMPLGQATVNVDGANALIDGLIQTGLLKEEDAMGARMMMGMFMKPTGNGDDSLTSEIEVKEGMQVFVNGQMIPM